MADALFPFAGLPVGVLLLLLGAVTFWDILAANGRSRGPDALTRESRFLSWLVSQARFGEDQPPSSKALIYWRVLLAWGIGSSMVAYWFARVIG